MWEKKIKTPPGRQESYLGQSKMSTQSENSLAFYLDL